MRSGLFCILVVFFYPEVFSQQAQYLFARVDISQGLSHNQVNSIIKDEKGFIWFGTMSGLNRYDGYSCKIFRHSDKDSSSLNDDYISQVWEVPLHKLLINTRTGPDLYDPVTEKFEHNPGAYFNSLHLPPISISDIKKDKKGDFWFRYYGNGLYCYDLSSKTTIHYTHKATDNSSIYSDSITDFCENAAGEIWLAHTGGILEKLNAQTGKITFRTNMLKQAKIAPADFRLFSDEEGDAWIYTQDAPNGVYYYKAYENKLVHIDKDAAGIHLNNNIITGILQDDKGMIWIATDHGGINLLNKKNFTVQYLLNREDDDKTISQNVITSFYKDKQGIIWIGTYKRGVSYYNENIFKFDLYRHQISDPYSLQYNDVNRFLEDNKGNLWIGTNGGGLIYFDRETGKFTQYKHDASNAASLSNDVIVSMYMDHNNNLWIGTYFGGLDCFDGKRFIHYRHSETNKSSISEDRIWEIFEDSENRLWIGTLAAGLDVFDREKNIFIHYPPLNNSLHSGYVSSLLEDRQGNLWIGTAVGIDVLQKADGKFVYYTHNATDTNSLSNDNIISLLEDNGGRIWIGTRNGLNIFNEQNKTFQKFGVEDGLPDNAILNILQDNANVVWISTSNGISKIITSVTKEGTIKINCKNYDESDGLQGREFNENAALKTKNGELIFGGANGFNIFNPAGIKTNPDIPAIAFTGLQVLNKSIEIGKKENNRVILPRSISEINAITLSYNENVFSIEFAALNFINSTKNKYTYMLEGFDKTWQHNMRKVTYTNLDPGKYTFRVKASNEDDVWNDKGIALTITILPPFWRTSFAYLLYAVIIAAMLYFARRIIIQRAHTRFEIAQERKEAQRLHELDMMKIRFFTNVSHEFKTPLSLILTPLDKIIKHTEDAEKKNQLQFIHRNARRLLNLVNQLLDFRKMEAQELKLNLASGDIIQFIKEISFSFTDIADKKNISFEYHSSVDEFYTAFDYNKIERILFNLLSNAFKFTPQNGTVSVNLHAEENAGETVLTINVKDTGIGIPLEKQGKIFERFFQNDISGSLINQGSGIGLAITKEFVKLHNGTIEVKSEPDRGSSFILRLPFKQLLKKDEFYTPQAEDFILISNSENPDEKETENYSLKKPVLLIIEDNDDFRFYLKDNLRQYYTVEEAVNGKEGWQKALACHPSLIVCDVAMPVISGIELCKKIKHDKRTDQIPVILLTAFAGEEEQLKGLATGAADYIIKPFSFELLISRIRNILMQQLSLKKVYTRHVQANPTQVRIQSADENFIQKALEIVEKNISDPDFSVEDFSRQLLLSRVAVYKKIFALTGQTPTEFIRSIRLKRAAQLLEKSQMTVAEIAYEVGFNNPKYFRRYFKEEFNMIPSIYQAEKKKSTLS